MRRRPVPGLRPRWTALALRALEWWLPAELGSAIAGDLAEEAPSHSSWWLARQALGAAVRVPLARARTPRSAVPLVFGALAAAVVLGLGDVTWHAVLSLVPRRAGHDPGAGWHLAQALLAGGAATAASWIGHWPDRRSS
ncbi:MAG: hypothetical protein MUF53_03680 [Gemmatimonadaceae bacterium]|jgi:hypothetical protein|nr:hypothetical protein [Gemmatimonadaceae bacterium]